MLSLYNRFASMLFSCPVYRLAIGLSAFSILLVGLSLQSLDAQSDHIGALKLEKLKNSKANDFTFDHSHDDFTATLLNVVHKKGALGSVDYPLLVKEPGLLKSYLKTIQLVSKAQFNTFSRAEQIAFLLNYYNAHQLYQVIEHYPLDSIRDLGFLLYTPWKQKFFTLFGKESYLDHIGHDFLAPYNEPRIHFALNCASISCPALSDEAYQGAKLEQQLTQASRDFLAEPSLNHYDSENNRLYLSSIFKWYLQDFGGTKGLMHFLERYMPAFPKQDDRVSIKYKEYNWGLNDLER